MISYLSNLNQWPTGSRPYLGVTAPHCLLRDRSLRIEQLRFGSMEHLLEHWAYMLFQSVEMLTLYEADWDAAMIARGQAEVARDEEITRQIAAAIGVSEAEADGLVKRSVEARKAIGAATIRGAPSVWPGRR
ncbi:hypothetical protein [Teichococcus vastitatis]|uniref:hypothetical protein n=1 Tax=Teichococcus vastitatis TaxID=2307076 RepID=UPI00130034F9|nr:hypothetical protein [Pseudoroseomonas vastitatis]